MPATPAYAEFLARTQQPCRLSRLDEAGHAELRAVLAEVGERRELTGYEQFALLFHADEGRGAQQGTYAVAFADGTRWDLFLVPVARLARGFVYQACFNRALDPAEASPQTAPNTI